MKIEGHVWLQLSQCNKAIKMYRVKREVGTQRGDPCNWAYITLRYLLIPIDMAERLEGYEKSDNLIDGGGQKLRTRSCQAKETSLS